VRLVWATDVHLDMLSDERVVAFARTIASQDPDRVLLSGDISVADALEHHLEILRATIQRPILFVLGNHDYYRSSIDAVRAKMTRTGDLVWLHGASPERIGRRTSIVGCDGWGDARIGNATTTPVLLSDFFLVKDLVGKSRDDLVRTLQALGHESRSALEGSLASAVKSADRILVLTHVPPFRESCWHEGQISDDDWLPFFTCKAVGDLLLEVARRYPDKHFEVYCGHTHGAGYARIRENLEVHTGAAAYGAPAIARVLEGAF
jgi:predicted phosphohydrolase